MEKADHAGNIRDLRAALTDEVLDHQDENPDFEFSEDGCICTHTPKCSYCEALPGNIFEALTELKAAEQAAHISAVALIEEFRDL